jgi:cytochrome c oxidase assembly protein subunit 15
MTWALALASVIILQAGIGIVTLLHVAPLPLALAHQAMAVVVLGIAVLHAERLGQGATEQGAVRVAG